MREKHEPSDSKYQRRRIIVVALVSLLLANSLFSLVGCADKNAPLSVTYTITSWADVQTALDRANNGDIIDLSSLWSPELQQSFKIPSNLELILIGHEHVAFYGVAFTCSGKNTITIENLRIVATNNQAQSALHFTGKQNQLIFRGSNEIRYSSAAEKSGYGAAIGVPSGVDLTIRGDGSLSVAGANGAASIGGGQAKPAGDISVDAPDGRLTVYYSDGGAGIGGGRGGEGGNTIISGGTMQLFGETPDSIFFGNSGQSAANSDGLNYSGAGIGGGSGAAAGKITINGGQISVTASGSAACIGGGSGGAGGVITFSGGFISANNLGAGTCLGGANGVTESSIKMTGGSMNVTAREKAINAIFDELPLAYRWHTSDMPILDMSEMKSFPGDPYRGSGTYSFIIIETHEITRVTVNPGTVDVPRGGEQVFSATVIATGGASTDVRWSVNGNVSLATQINIDGTLIVAEDETAQSITVIATSITYSDKSGEATVAIVAAPSTP